MKAERKRELLAYRENIKMILEDKNEYNNRENLLRAIEEQDLRLYNYLLNAHSPFLNLEFKVNDNVNDKTDLLNKTIMSEIIGYKGKTKAFGGKLSFTQDAYLADYQNNIYNDNFIKVLNSIRCVKLYNTFNGAREVRMYPVCDLNDNYTGDYRLISRKNNIDIPLEIMNGEKLATARITMETIVDVIELLIEAFRYVLFDLRDKDVFNVSLSPQFITEDTKFDFLDDPFSEDRVSFMKSKLENNVTSRIMEGLFKEVYKKLGLELIINTLSGIEVKLGCRVVDNPALMENGSLSHILGFDTIQEELSALEELIANLSRIYTRNYIDTYIEDFKKVAKSKKKSKKDKK